MKKRRSRERDHVSIHGPDTLLKRTPGGSPSLALPPSMGNGLEGPGPISNSLLSSA